MFNIPYPFCGTIPLWLHAGGFVLRFYLFLCVLCDSVVKIYCLFSASAAAAANDTNEKKSTIRMIIICIITIFNVTCNNRLCNRDTRPRQLTHNPLLRFAHRHFQIGETQPHIRQPEQRPRHHPENRQRLARRP